MIKTLIGGPRVLPPEGGTGRGKLVICQIMARLPKQCCGEKADQIWLCEVIGPHPRSECRVGEHTMIHERLGNGHACSGIEYWVDNGGLAGLMEAQYEAWR